MKDRSGNIDGFKDSTMSSWRPAGVGVGSLKGEHTQTRGGHRHRGPMPRTVVSQALLAYLRRDRA